jgi:hypothetical protein
VMKQFCQIFRAYIMNRRHRPLAFLYNFTAFRCVPALLPSRVSQRRPARNPLSKSSMFMIAGTTIYFLLSQLTPLDNETRKD